MAKYTMTINYLVENGFDFQLDEYPIFDEEYRPALNKLILDNFMMDEIGFETPALFRHFLKTKLNEIMPYYNLLFKAQKEVIESSNIFSNVNLQETLEREVNLESTSEGSSTSTSENRGKSVAQDTPQGKLKYQDIDNYDYASQIVLNKNEGSANVTDNTSSTGNNLENYVKTISGNNGKMYNIEVLQKALNGFMNINTRLLKELEPLFMGVF